MSDIPSRKILGLNQQTCQRLKLALGLHLRRQVFIAVCDDLTLRDRIANQLVIELAYPSVAADASGLSEDFKRYPRFVTLQLNLSDPNPIAQIAQWVTQFPPPRSGKRRATLPTFQFLGIENLTRQPVAVQRLFFAHLQSIERNLVALESGLLLWLPQPWFHALPQSADKFWQCRTGIFEFIGDPTPVATPQPSPVETAQPAPIAGTPPITPTLPVVTLPSISVRDPASIPLADPAQTDVEVAPPGNPSTPVVNGNHPSPKPSPTISSRDQTQVAPVFPAPAPAIAKETNSVGEHSADHAADRSAASALNELLTPAPATPPVTPLLPLVTQAATPLPKKREPATPPSPLPATPHDAAAEPFTLVHQIEALHQQQASPTDLAEAYRALGNYYRDRIERGEVSPQHLTVAIHAYEQVLVWLPETSPLWTEVLNDLGNFYWMFSRTTTAEDALARLQQAVQAYRLALTKLDLQTQPHAYPMVQNNLGSAYADLARYQNPIEHLQASIQAYQQTLRFRNPDVEPLRYASTQNNLGTAYWNLAQHQQPETQLKQAIAAYSEALRYYNPEQEPLNYAMIQNNLGTAYWNLAQHERPQEWLRLAIDSYQTALKYRTLDVVPTAFAATQNNLGTAYWHLASYTADDAPLRLNYLQKAIYAYETTLLATQQLAGQPQLAPLAFDATATHNNLGLAHYQLATDAQLELAPEDRSIQLEAALDHHLTALQGWQQQPELYETVFNCVLQTIRALYERNGLAGQNIAFSKVPSHLLPKILAQL